MHRNDKATLTRAWHITIDIFATKNIVNYSKSRNERKGQILDMLTFFLYATSGIILDMGSDNGTRGYNVNDPWLSGTYRSLFSTTLAISLIPLQLSKVAFHVIYVFYMPVCMHANIHIILSKLPVSYLKQRTHLNCKSVAVSLILYAIVHSFHQLLWTFTIHHWWIDVLLNDHYTRIFMVLSYQYDTSMDYLTMMITSVTGMFMYMAIWIVDLGSLKLDNLSSTIVHFWGCFCPMIFPWNTGLNIFLAEHFTSN